MSPRVQRVLFGLLVIVVGTLTLAPFAFGKSLSKDFFGMAVICELAVVAVGAGIALTAPPPALTFARAPAPAPAPGPAPASVYRGVVTPPPTITKASAKRITLAILAALAFTAAAVPFAVHLPRWVEGEIVVAAWWAIWSTVLAVVAYRGATVDDDHRPTGSVVDLGGIAPKWRWTSLLDSSPDLEGCVIALAVFIVVAIALAGAWLVVELVAPAVFIVAYRCVVRAFARARAAETKGNAARSALVGMGWAAAYTAPLAAIVAVAHALFTR